MEQRRERVRVETERHRITGTLTLPRGGYRARVSDQLNTNDRDFLALTDAYVESLDGGMDEVHEFVAVARRHVVFAVVLSSDPA